MRKTSSRREFLKMTTAAVTGTAILAGHPSLAALGANDRVRIGVIGCNGRGMNHITSLLSVPNVEIAYVCDVDRRALDKGVASVAKRQSTQARGVSDLRHILDDKQVDAVAIATPDHWHAPASIMACAAGKHVYVEKPGSHNGHESELIVTAARRNKRVVQMGNQRRSWPWVIEAIQTLHSGEIGPAYFARGWYTNRRPSIGKGKTVPVPDWLDFNLWQGPAPEESYRDNLVHYNWHWFWTWGTGELGNNGVHALDLARWGLQVDLPARITCGGNRYFFQDDWQTPDTIIATFDFGTKGIVWEGQSCAPRGFEGAGFGVSFFGERGCLSIAGNECRIYDTSDKLVRSIGTRQNELFQYDVVHFANFVDAIRDGASLKAEIEEGQKSTLMCHLGNIAWRSGETIEFDPRKRQLSGSRKARALWARDYRKGWAPKV